ncbi:MAG: PilZ domain-containing protein [Pseudomonadota bacterium]
MLSPYSGQERRQHVRQQSDLPARIVMARDTLVFCQTLDLSEGGACLRRPGRFRVDIGELLVLAGGGMLGTGAMHGWSMCPTPCCTVRSSGESGR